MAFTTSNDINILQASDSTNISAGAGDDKYIISGDLISENQTISISDTEGSNTIQLVGGLSITSSSVAADAAQLTLSNGAVITLLGASSFSYLVGGDSLTGSGGTTEDYSTFATNTLGVSAVPAEGEDPAAGTAVEVGGGSAGEGQTFELTNSATADTIIGTSGSDTITGASGTVANADTIIDQSTTDADVANLVVNTSAGYTPTNITNVETVNLDWDAFGTATYDLAGVNNATNVNLTSSKVGFLGSATVTNANAMTLTAGSGMVGTLTASGFKTGTVDGGTATAMVINGSGTNADNESLTVTAGTNTTSFTVGTTNGAKSMTLDAGTATTIAVGDAGNTSDAVSLTVNADATITNAGTGDLTINMQDGNDITIDTIANSLTLTGEGDQTVTVGADDLNAETVTNSKTAGSLVIKSADTDGEDLSKVNADTIWFTGVNGGANTIASGANLKFSGSGSDVNLTVSGSGTNDTAAVEVTTGTIDDVVLTGVESATITAAASAVSGADLIIDTADLNGNTLVLTGTNDVQIDDFATAGEGGSTVDANALSGTLTVNTNTTANSEDINISGGTGVLTVTTSNISGNIVTTGQTGNDSITANATTTGSLTAILSDGANTVSATGLTTGTLVVQSGSGIDTVTAGAALTTGVINLSLGDGNNVANLDDGAGAGTITVTTGGGTDTLSFTGSLDDANDTLTWSAGSGTDTLILVTEGADISASKVTLTDVEVIQIAADTGSDTTAEASIAAGDVSGTTLTIKASSYDAGNDVEVKGDANTDTIDLSGVSFDTTITNGIGNTIVTSSTSTKDQTVTGSSISDLITTGTGKDTIVAGNGADTVTAGNGNDTIDLTETTANSAVDMVVLAASGNGYDTITGFKSGTDQITFGDAATAATGGAAVFAEAATTVVSSAVAFDISGTSATTNDVIELSTTLTSNGDLDTATDGAELLKALSSSSSAAATQITLSGAANTHLIAYQDGNAYLYYASSADANLIASEISLIAVVNSVTAGSLVAADFVAL